KVRVNACDPDLPPTVSVPGPQTVLQGGTLTLGSAPGNAITVGDPDIGAYPARVTLAVGHGTITLGSTAGLSFTTGDGTDDPTMRLTGTLAKGTAALTGRRYTPAAGFAGPAPRAIRVDDQGKSGVDGPKTATTGVQITVTQTQCPPQAPVRVTSNIAGGK